MSGPDNDGIRLTGGTVPAAWVDYNRHMNIGYYAIAFDQALDRLLEDHLGMGEGFARETGHGPFVLQSASCFLAEQCEGDAFDFTARVLDSDAKRVHLFLRMHRVADDAVLATSEQLLINVDLTARRGTPYPEAVRAIITAIQAEQAALPWPAQAGSALGIRRG
ncbi:MAG: thioesterase [Gammaproteobacteria bacterium]|nr:thioesterase [Gammaproteobacteria bacterium]